MIQHIDAYRDGGTVGIKLSHTISLALRFNEDPQVKAVAEKYQEICIDHRIGSATIGRMTIGYPDNPDAIEITDQKIIDWILLRSKEHVQVQKNWYKQMKVDIDLRKKQTAYRGE